MTKKNNQIKITVYGYDVATTEEATRLVSEKISQLKLTFKGPVPLPIRKKVATVPISPHKHKSSQEQFIWKVHRRMINIASISPTALEALEKLRVPSTAHLEVESSL